MGVAWRPGSSFGVMEGLGKVRQEVSALDRPAEMNCEVRGMFFKVVSLIQWNKHLLVQIFLLGFYLFCFVRSREIR